MSPHDFMPKPFFSSGPTIGDGDAVDTLAARLSDAAAELATCKRQLNNTCDQLTEANEILSGTYIDGDDDDDGGDRGGGGGGGGGADEGREGCAIGLRHQHQEHPAQGSTAHSLSELQLEQHAEIVRGTIVSSFSCSLQ